MTMKLLTIRQALRVLYLLFIIVPYNTTVKAQGIYQDWGTTYQGGTDNIGVVFSTDSSTTKQYWFTDAHPTGRTVRQLSLTSSGQYNVSDLKQGVYLLRLINDKEVVVARFVKL